MGSRQLVAFGFVLICVRFINARSLSMKMPTYWWLNAQKPEADQPRAEPEREHSRQFAQEPAIFQSKQSQQAVEPLSWKFPEDPVEPVAKAPLNFNLRQPVADSRLAVRCGESVIQVEVKQDLLGLGKLIQQEEITLGGCSAIEVDDLSHVLMFRSELHGCGSTLVV